MTAPQDAANKPSTDLIIPRAARGRFLSEDDALQLRCREAEQPKVLLGDLSITGVPEVLVLINSSLRTGELVLQSDVARKVLSFVDGECVAVQTNVPDDRLGEVMWRQGIISLDQLMIAASQLDTGKRLGRLLIDNGFIGTPQLYQGLRAQVREVFLSVFHFRSGMFCFLGHEPKLFTPVSLEGSTESLIFDGVRQLDEFQKLRRTFGSFDTEVQAVTPLPGGVKLRDTEEAVVQLLTSARKPLSLRAVLDKAHLGEFQGLRALAKLLDCGYAEITRAEAPAQPAPERPEPIVAAVQVINIVTGILHDEFDGADRWIQMYLEDLEVAGTSIFQDLPPARRTQIDGAALLARAKSMGDEAVAELTAVLRETMDFAMFQASETLDEDRSGELFGEVATLLGMARTR